MRLCSHVKFVHIVLVLLVTLYVSDIGKVLATRRHQELLYYRVVPNREWVEKRLGATLWRLFGQLDVHSINIKECVRE
jgi:hypothetical protein